MKKLLQGGSSIVAGRGAAWMKASKGVASKSTAWASGKRSQLCWRVSLVDQGNWRLGRVTRRVRWREGQ